MDVLRNLLQAASIISLDKGQTLYTFMQTDNMIYFVLFGRIFIYTTSDESDPQNASKNIALGRVTMGWTLGEEVLYDQALQVRCEQAVADKDSCVIGI